jgi:SAM-dependent methyltransferase
MPSARALAGIYAQDGAWAAEHSARSNVKKGGQIVDQLDQYVGLRHRPHASAVLDVGCGAGRWLNTLAGFGWKTFGIEPSTKAAFAAHRELAEIPREPTFDLIIVHHVLEHVRHPGEMLHDCARALKPDGWLFVSVPNLSGLPHFRDWYYCLNGRAHVVAYTHEALQCLFSRAGLRWHCCLDDPQAVVEKRAGSSRTRVLARKRGPDDEPPAVPSHPLDAAVRALSGAGLL